MYTVYDSRGRIVDTADAATHSIHNLCHKHGFPYRDTLLGITKAGEHAHNGMLITLN